MKHVVSTPVRYQGIVYRSASEARLAVFLTTRASRRPRAIGIRSPASDLPDFELPHRLWIEVKGAYEPALDGWRKAALVVLASGRALMFWSGDDWLNSGQYILVRNATVFLGHPPRGTPIDPERDFVFEHGDRVITIRRRRAYWTICRSCNSPGLVVGESPTGWCFGCDSTEPGDRRHPRLELATRAALAHSSSAWPGSARRARGYAVLRPDRFRRK